MFIDVLLQAMHKYAHSIIDNCNSSNGNRDSNNDHSNNTTTNGTVHTQTLQYSTRF
jgi:hypothetical protein